MEELMAGAIAALDDMLMQIHRFFCNHGRLCIRAEYRICMKCGKTWQA